MDADTLEVLKSIVNKLTFKSNYCDTGIHDGEWRVSFGDVYLTARELTVLQDLRYGETK